MWLLANALEKSSDCVLPSISTEWRL